MQSIRDLIKQPAEPIDPRFKLIEEARKDLLADDRVLNSLPGKSARFDTQTISSAARGSKHLTNCSRLAAIAGYLRPESIVELGTNLGISSAYLAIGAPDARVFTLEASGVRLNIARTLHSRCLINNVEYIEGYFSETLPDVLNRVESVGLCFIDGDHTFDATLAYLAALRVKSPPGSVIVLDDIGWSDEMRRLWQEVKQMPAFETFKAGGMGFCINQGIG